MNKNNYLERLRFHIIIWNSDNHLCGKKTSDFYMIENLKAKLLKFGHTYSIKTKMSKLQNKDKTFSWFTWNVIFQILDDPVHEAGFFQ